MSSDSEAPQGSGLLCSPTHLGLVRRLLESEDGLVNVLHLGVDLLDDLAYHLLWHVFDVVLRNLRELFRLLEPSEPLQTL